MRKRRQLLAVVATAALLAVPAAPAHALPHCTGTWKNYARCTFEAPAGAFIMKGIATEGPEDGYAEVSVRVFVEIAGVQHTVASCANYGSVPVTCMEYVDSPFDGWTHVCEVYGDDSGGTYGCYDPPYLPLPI